VSSVFVNPNSAIVQYHAAFSSRENDTTILDITPTIDTTALLKVLEKNKELPDSGILGGLLCASYAKTAEFEIKSSTSHEPTEPGILYSF
jgi:hypothetical protein